VKVKKIQSHKMEFVLKNKYGVMLFANYWGKAKKRKWTLSILFQVLKQQVSSDTENWIIRMNDVWVQLQLNSEIKKSLISIENQKNVNIIQKKILLFIFISSIYSFCPAKTSGD
jgi:hypothetical protein